MPNLTTQQIVIALTWLVIAAVGDVLAVIWQENREKKQPFRAAGTSFLMTIFGWLPIIVLVTTWNWLIVVADLVGNAAGSYVGVKWFRK